MDSQKFNMLIELLYSYDKFKNLLPRIRQDIIYKELESQGNADTVKLLQIFEEGLKYKDTSKSQLIPLYGMSYNDYNGLDSKLLEININYKGEELILRGGLWYNKYPDSYKTNRYTSSHYLDDYIKKSYKELKAFQEKESIIIELIDIVDNAILKLDSRESKLIFDCYINIDRKNITDMKKVFGISSRTTIYKLQDDALNKMISIIDFDRVQKLYDLLFKKKVTFENYYEDMDYSNPYEEDVEEDDYSADYLDKPSEE